MVDGDPMSDLPASTTLGWGDAFAAMGDLDELRRSGNIETAVERGQVGGAVATAWVRPLPDDACGDPGLALVEVDLRPVSVLTGRPRDGLDGVVVVDPRRTLDAAAVDRRDVLTGAAEPLPLPADEVEDPVGIEGLRGSRAGAAVDLGPRGAWLEDERHGRAPDVAVGVAFLSRHGTLPRNRSMGKSGTGAVM